MEIWETAAAILGSDEELALQEEGWEPFGGGYVPRGDVFLAVHGHCAVLYRRKREGLAEVKSPEQVK